MIILCLNCGGSSIKYEVFQIHSNEELSLCRGTIKRLERDDATLTQWQRGKKQEIHVPGTFHEQGLSLIIQTLTNNGPLKGIQEIDAVAIKLINGGKKASQTTLINDEVVAALEEFSNITGVHNPPALMAIQAFRRILPSTPLVGVFETTFHLTVPPSHRAYGLPSKLVQKYGIEKLGFHGNSHRFIAERLKTVSPHSSKIISCHLGSGCSICAIRDGKSFDITSGFTPQSGTIMSTRPGDFDAQVITYLQEKEHMSWEEINHVLLNQSGLLGISGMSGEMWELEKAMRIGNDRCRLAIEVFIYQVKKALGAFTAIMNGVDAVSFTGGIGENDPFIRKEICHQMESIGLILDHEVNTKARKETRISSLSSPAEIWVIPTNEELMVAREASKFLKDSKECI